MGDASGEQRIALLIGGAGGIGAAAARRLAAQGLRIVIADLDLDNARTVARALPGEGHGAVRVDILDEKSVEDLFAVVEADPGPVTVLVHIAGGPLVNPAEPQSISDTSLDNWSRTEALNSRGAFLAVREFMRRREGCPVEDGRLILIGSMAGVAPSGLHTGISYAASKAAAINVARFAALEGARLQITANAIAPGTILTDVVLSGTTEMQRAAIASGTPLKRLGRPEDIASAVAFFAERDAGFATGCVLEINGGRHMG